MAESLGFRSSGLSKIRSVHSLVADWPGALARGGCVPGVTRFAYGLLLPAMRTDLGWSYTLAGGMNTANALGYFWALVTPWLLRRWGPGTVLVGGALLATVFMGLSGFFVAAEPLLLQRLLAGLASALVFIAGGLLAARLGAGDPARGGFLIGLYYGGTGLGVVVSALLVPAVLDWAHAEQSGPVHTWRWAWWALAAICLAGSAALVWPARAMARMAAPLPGRCPLPRPCLARPRRLASLTGGTLPMRWAATRFFGVGYIGYMTFVVALLREQGSSAQAVSLHLAGLGSAGFVPHLGGFAGPARRWPRFGHAQRFAGLRHDHPGRDGLPAGGAGVGAAVEGSFCRWWRPPRPWCGITSASGLGGRR